MVMDIRKGRRKELGKQLEEPSQFRLMLGFFLPRKLKRTPSVFENGGKLG
jgi:hypothetical protein